MRKYELTILISSDLTEQEVRSVEDDISSFIEEKGSLIGLSTPIKRDLGYEINKKSQAYVMDLRFNLDPNLISEFEKKLQEKKEIVRHIFLVKPDKEKPDKEPRRRENKLKPTGPTLRSPKKVELGDIDKKIDEILSE